VLGDEPRRWRVFDEFGIGCRSGTRLGHRDLRGYQDPLLLKSYERVVASLRSTPALAAQFNVRYALTGPHFLHGWNRHYLPPPDALQAEHGATPRGDGVYVLDQALPFAYWVPDDQVERAPDRPAALARTAALAPAPFAIVEGDGPSTVGTGSLPRAMETAGRLQWGRDRVRFRIHAGRAGQVVVNEVWYPGWQATVDGEPVPIHRANGLVRAVAVGPGQHEVEMIYRPPWGVALRCLWALGWVLAVLLLCWRPMRRSLAEPHPH